jgi:hypothetical protein
MYVSVFFAHVFVVVVFEIRIVVSFSVWMHLRFGFWIALDCDRLLGYGMLRGSVARFF